MPFSPGTRAPNFTHRCVILSARFCKTPWMLRLCSHRTRKQFAASKPFDVACELCEHSHWLQCVSFLLPVLRSALRPVWTAWHQFQLWRNTGSTFGTWVVDSSLIVSVYVTHVAEVTSCIAMTYAAALSQWELKSQGLRLQIYTQAEHYSDEYAYSIPCLYATLVHQGKGTKYPR